MLNQPRACLSQLVWSAVLVASLASCQRRAAPEPTSAAAIFPRGGSVTARTGSAEVEIEVPPGALDEEIELTARVLPSGETPAGALGPGVELGPHGTRFKKPVAIRFRPKVRESFASIPLPLYRVATYVEDHWELLPTKLLPGGVVEGLTTHFSTFALVGDCMIVGTGKDFPLTACPTFNPRVRTSEEVTLRLNAGQLMTNIFIDAAPAVGEVEFSLEGLSPNTAYYLKSDDAVLVEELHADEQGVIKLTRTLSQPRLILVSPVHGSLTLDSPAACVPPVGTWIGETATCALLEDLPEAEVTIVADGVTLDCRDPNTGVTHFIGTPERRAGFGVNVYGRSNVAIRNCDIRNVDNGVLGTITTGLVIDNVGIDATRPSAGAFLSGGTTASLSNLRIRNVHIGIYSQPGNQVRIASSTISDVQYGLSLFPGDGPVTDVSIRNASWGVLAGLTGTFEVRRVGVINDASFSGAAGVMVYQGATAIIADSLVARAQAGIQLQYDAPGNAIINSTVTCGLRGVVLDPTSPAPVSVFHSNFFGQRFEQVTKYGPDTTHTELSDTSSSSPTFQEGNFWGHNCPEALFVPGDANRDDISDSFPYGRMSAWTSGGTPGCGMPAALAAPVAIAPVISEIALTGSPLFVGAAEPGATVELVEGGVVKGQGTADECGIFEFLPAVALGDGAHTVALRARKGDGASALSATRTFSVEGAEPPLAAPVLTFPTDGAIVGGATPTFTGTATVGATVELLEAGLLKGSAIANDAGVFELTSSAFADGTHTVTARLRAGTAVSPESSPLTFRIDTTPPPAPRIDFPTAGSSVSDSNVPVSGFSEAGAVVSIRESGTVLGNALALETGRFLTSIGPLSSGSHTIEAVAIDAAGNASPPSPVVSFTIDQLVSTSSPLVGDEGQARLVFVRDYQDPFIPTAGEINRVELQGTLKMPAGVHVGQVIEAVMERTVVNLATGAALTLDTSVVRISAESTGNTSPFDIINEWNGKNLDGTIAPEGVYQSSIRLNFIRLLPGDFFPPDCNLEQSSSRCMDSFDLQLPFILYHQRPPLVTIPLSTSVPTLNIEDCNGLDDDGDGAIDEGATCRNDSVMACTCQPTTCADQGYQCGSHPDGCGGTINCGAPCAP